MVFCNDFVTISRLIYYQSCDHVPTKVATILLLYHLATT